MRCLRRILSISWKDKVTNNAVLERADIPSMYTLLRQRRLRWLGHVRRMADGRIPKDILYGELELGSRPVGRPKLRFRDVCKRDMLAIGLPPDNWEPLAEDRSKWKKSCRHALQAGERKLNDEADVKRAKRKAAAKASASVPVESSFSCVVCSRVCQSRIGLISHQRKCLLQLR